MGFDFFNTNANLEVILDSESQSKITGVGNGKLNFKININTIDHKNFKKNIIDINSINLINVFNFSRINRDFTTLRNTMTAKHQ